MFDRRWFCLALPLCVFAAAADETWKSKAIAEWNEGDAKDFLTESPWVKSFTPGIKPASSGTTSRRMNSGGIGMGPVGIGGMGRRGMGGGGYPGGGQSRRDDGAYSGEPPKLTLRWESAMPVRSAELKVHDNDAPTIDEKHYAIAVYGIPDRMLTGETKKLQDQLKKEASIKRDGKKDFKPSGVEVIERPDGPVVVYFFPNSTEISKEDRRAEFDATIGRLLLSQSFFIDEMVWQGKIEL
jgi:hypothetical protein